MEQETADDQLIVEIASLAREFAMNIVEEDPAEDIAQDVALQCLMKIRAGKWRVEAAALRDFVRRVVRMKAADLLRLSQSRDEQHAQYALEAHASHAWTLPELAYEERELAEFHEEGLERMPEVRCLTHPMLPDEDETDRSVALSLEVRRTTAGSDMVTCQQRSRSELAAHAIGSSVKRSRRTSRATRRRAVSHLDTAYVSVDAN